MSKCKGHNTVELKKYFKHLQPPAMGTFAASTVSANLVDRVASMPPMVALVSIFGLSTENNILCGSPKLLLFNLQHHSKCGKSSVCNVCDHKYEYFQNQAL